MTFTHISFMTITEVTFHNVTIEQNEAAIGGGGSFHFTELFWDKGEMLHCFPPDTGFEPCQRFYMSNVTIRHNTANFAGGLFTTHPDYMILTCDPETPQLNNTLKTIYTKQLNTKHEVAPTKHLECMSISSNEIKVESM